MDKRVTCPSCENKLTVKIWSETLSQVIRCPECKKKFTYDPTKESKEPPVKEQAKASKGSTSTPVSDILGKGLKAGLKAATAPVKMATREMDRINNSLKKPGPQPPAPLRKFQKEEESRETEPKGSGADGGKKSSEKKRRITGSKKINCPYCDHGFQAGLPDNDKEILTTKCPDCSKIFTFQRETPEERKIREWNEKIEKEQQAKRKKGKHKPDIKHDLKNERNPKGDQARKRGGEPGQTISEKTILEMATKKKTTSEKTTPDKNIRDKSSIEEDDDEDFAIPVQLREKMERERQAAEELDKDYQDEDGGHGTTSEGWDHGKSDDDDRDHDFDTPSEGGERDYGVSPAPDEIKDQDDDFITDAGPSSESSKMGHMVSILCPYCNEGFNTPAPRKKKKVNCPICEEDFWINHHGEYIARKALGGFMGGLARVVGVEAIQEYQETVKESMEGFHILSDPGYLKQRVRKAPGVAGLLLVIVAILGILFAGALMVSIPGIGEEDEDGTVSVSGNVLNDMDTIEGALVNITDLGIQMETNSMGNFYFEDVPIGDHTLEISAPGNGTLIVKFTVNNNDAKRNNKDLSGLVLPGNGTTTQDMRDDRVERAGLITGIFAAFVFVVSLIALMGGLLALQAKRFKATLFLSVISVASIGFTYGIMLSIIAVVCIIIGRKEFSS